MYKFEGIDGREMLNNLLLAGASGEGKNNLAKFMAVFNKYKLSLMDGFALLLELASVLKEPTKDGEDDV